MIVTLTANPSLDRTIQLAGPLEPGAVQAAESSSVDPAGKGVNVSRVVVAAGADTLAVLPLAEDDPYGEHTAGLPVRAVPIEGHARSNITLTSPDGETTKINLPGAGLAPAEAGALIDAVVEAADGARWLALCGSLPPGVAADFYVEVIQAVRTRAARAPRIAVDTSGPALAEVLARGAVDLIKPNDEELVDAVARLGLATSSEADQDTVADAVRLASTLVPHRVGAVLVTLGGDGAVLVDAEGARHAAAPPTDVRSTVGAGDSALAGFLLADLAGEDADGRLRAAIRYGSATAALPGTRIATPADLPGGDIPVRTLP